MGSCITPFTVKHKTKCMSIAVPCGKCPECMKRRVSAWSFRLMQEEKVSTSAHFITLTYDTDHVPFSRNGYMTLAKRDVQLFLKRLRFDISKKYADVKIKYYLAGEYGGRTQRPHYHAIMFNVPDLDLIETAWQLGSINYGQVSDASVGYTLKYINKTKRIPAHRNDDRIPEFALMSKGLGASYLTPSIIQYHHADLLNRACLTIADGKKVSMPRYYKEKIYTELERKRIAHFQQIDMIARQLKLEEDQMYEWNKLQSDLQKFRKQEQSAQKRDRL